MATAIASVNHNGSTGYKKNSTMKISNEMKGKLSKGMDALSGNKMLYVFTKACDEQKKRFHETVGKKTSTPKPPTS